MKMLGSMLVVGAVLSGYHAYTQHQDAKALREVLANSDANGFVELPLPVSQDVNAIYVVAAQNCPHAAAQKADQLAERLKAQGLPVVRTQQVMFGQPQRVDPAAISRLNVVMNAPLPLVFVHGRAASNPDLKQVLAEFQSGSPGSAEAQR